MHVITVNLLVFFVFVVLPLLSFLRHNRAFRGGAKEMVEVSKRRRARQERREHAYAESHHRVWKRVLLRLVFAFVLITPVNYVVYTNLKRLAEHGGRVEQLCEGQLWLQQVAPWLPSLFTFALVSRSGADGSIPTESAWSCDHQAGVQLLARLVRALPLLFLVVALVLDVSYVFIFYIDGREYGLQKRHNDSGLNRFINAVKFRYYLPYVNWKCRIVRNYFSAELVTVDGPLPLFRYPSHKNNERRQAAQLRHTRTATRLMTPMHQGMPVTVNAAQAEPPQTSVGARSPSPVSSSAPIDDWDEEERAALAAQARDAHARTHLPLSQWATASATAAVAATASEACDVENDHEAPEALMECTRYLFAAHPHGILPLGALVAMMSNVTNRDRILFVDNRPFTAESVEAAERDSGGVGSSELCNRSLSTRCRARGAGPTDQPPSQKAPGARDGCGSPVLSATSSPKFTTTNTRYLSPAAASVAAVFPLACSPPLSPVPQVVCDAPGPSSPLSSSPVLPLTPETVATSDQTMGQVPRPRRRYARGRHYIYDKELRAFRLLPTRDEAIPPAGLRAPSASSPGRSQFGDRICIRLRAVVATFPFFIPIMREVYIFHGMLDASYASCRRVLESNLNPVVREVWGWARRRRGHATGETPKKSAPSDTTTPTATDSADASPPTVMDYNSLLVFPGGASEALLSSREGPARLLLRRRKGFVRLALQTGSSLVPCYTFGETDYYDQWGTQTWRDAAVYEDDDSVVWGHHQDGEQGDGGGGEGATPSTADLAQVRRYYHDLLLTPTDEDVSASATRTSAISSGSNQTSRPSATNTAATSPSSTCEHVTATSASPPRRGSVHHAHRPREAEASRRPPRWIQWIQRGFQDTFGISLPLVKNIFPHRCKLATVVGRPLYFELPPDLARMYAEPDQFYDVELERAVVAAAQDVYMRELQQLFDKYAPVYLSDHKRRRLIIA